MSTDTSEKGLEALIARSLVDDAGYLPGDPKDYDRDHAVDAPKLLAFRKRVSEALLPFCVVFMVGRLEAWSFEPTLWST